LKVAGTKVVGMCGQDGSHGGSIDDDVLAHLEVSNSVSCY
jgi:hypothetical protein